MTIVTIVAEMHPPMAAWQHLTQRTKEDYEFRAHHLNSRTVIGETNHSHDALNAPQDSVRSDVVERGLTDDVQHEMRRSRKCVISR